ncbi:ISL3 family transposase, partial [Eubacterium sp. OF10-16]
MDYSYIFKLLSLPDDGSISIDNVEVAGDTKYVYISRPPITTYCPNCSCRMHSEGIYKRKIKHPILQDSTCIIFIVSQRKWKCTNCKTYV